jgi:hypothetical protein
VKICKYFVNVPSCDRDACDRRNFWFEQVIEMVAAVVGMVSASILGCPLDIQIRAIGECHFHPVALPPDLDGEFGRLPFVPYRQN